MRNAQIFVPRGVGNSIEFSALILVVALTLSATASRAPAYPTVDLLRAKDQALLDAIAPG